MAVGLQVYSDSNCTQELTWSTDHYVLPLSATTGLDGTTGEVAVSSIWVKNTGTILVSNVVLLELLDAATRGSYSLNGTDYNATTVTLGSMATSGGTQIVRVYVKVTVAASTNPATNVALNFKIGGTVLNA